MSFRRMIHTTVNGQHINTASMPVVGDNFNFNKTQVNRQYINRMSINRPNANGTNKICVVSIFKNEAHIIAEWLNHYIKNGVDIFYLIDNGSTDNYMYILDKYIKTGKVILIKDTIKHQQVNLYNKYFLNVAKKCDWVIVVDLDEFMFSRRGFNTIKDYLNSLNNTVNQIFIPWKMFGSSGHINQPKSVIKNFNLRIKYNKAGTIKGKYIVRGSKLIRFNIHYSDINTNSGNITSDNNTIKLNEPIVKISEQILFNSSLHLNHYSIQSLDFFKTVKMTRGDNVNASSDNIRDINYFNAYDYKDIIDNELKNKN